MRNASGKTAITAILFIGVLAFFLLMLSSLGLRRSLAPDVSQRVQIRERYSPFDQARAMRDLEALTSEIGPRPAGSEGALAARDYLRRELFSAGFTPQLVDFPCEYAGAASECAHVFARSHGDRNGVIALAAHYDTAPLDFPYAGANAGGAATAWLLEFARGIGPRNPNQDVLFLWMDAEAAPNHNATPEAPGRAALSGAFSRLTGDAPAAWLYFEGIGDCYLQVAADSEGEAWLRQIVLDTAGRLRYGRHFTAGPTPAPRAWLAGALPGMHGLNLVDPMYGGTPLTHKELWHTPADTIENICPQSLQAVSDVIYHALPAIGNRLETLGQGAS